MAGKYDGNSKYVLKMILKKSKSFTKSVWNQVKYSIFVGVLSFNGKKQLTVGNVLC